MLPDVQKTIENIWKQIWSEPKNIFLCLTWFLACLWVSTFKKMLILIFSVWLYSVYEGKINGSRSH